MTELNIDEIPVVDPKDSTLLLGLLSRRELTLAYTSFIESLRSPGTIASPPSSRAGWVRVTVIRADRPQELFMKP